MQIDPARTYKAVFTTDVGQFTVRLFPDQAPVTVNNFVFLARQGYYDNTTFHRVLPGFMAQGGDPTGTGAGGPGYTFEDEFSPDLQFDRPGLLAMANRGPDTNGGQFFITFAPTPHLNGLHTIFGEVIDGPDTLDRLRPRDPQADPDYVGSTLLSVEIVETDG
jgi:cyclophilin family peptidyl-prolyl cis-trans isomerase